MDGRQKGFTGLAIIYGQHNDEDSESLAKTNNLSSWMVATLIGVLFFCPMMTYGCEEALNSKERNRRYGVDRFVCL